MAKDGWDITEIVGKVAGAVLIPSVIAIGGLYFNAQENQRARQASEAASRRAATAQMMQIAVGVLSSKPTEETAALRKWATEVLEKPGEIIALNRDAAIQLESSQLAPNWGGFYATPLPFVPGDPGEEIRVLPYEDPKPEFEFQGGPADE